MKNVLSDEEFGTFPEILPRPYFSGARKLSASACSPVKNSASSAVCTSRALATRESPMKDRVSITTL